MFRQIILTLIATLAVACSKSNEVDSDGSRYVHLCEIYEQTVGGSQNPSIEQSMALAKRITEELPSLKESSENWSMLPPQEVYQSILKSAREELGDDWECQAIEEFYTPSNQTDSPK